MDQVWIQIIITVGSIAGSIIIGGYTAARYAISELRKARKDEREELFQLFRDMQSQMVETIQKLQTQHFEVYNSKNGQLERVTTSTLKTIDILRDQFVKALNKIHLALENQSRLINEGNQLTRKAITVAEEIKE